MRRLLLFLHFRLELAHLAFNLTCSFNNGYNEVEYESVGEIEQQHPQKVF